MSLRLYGLLGLFTVPGVDISVAQLAVLSVTKGVDVSILHQNHWTTR